MLDTSDGRSTNMRRYPKRKESSRTAKIGVDTVSSIVNDNLKWLFRVVHGEEDFGVDGYIDVVLDDGSVTGQSIAVQVKCGKRFLRDRSNVGYIFRGERKHLNLYLNSQVPVIIILCDPETRICYWEHFDPRKTDKTPKGWKMTVPFVQVLDAQSKGDLLRIVGEAEDHTNALEHHWRFTTLLKQAGRILYTVDRKDIESGDVENIADFFQRLQLNLDVCQKVQGKIEISVSGYDLDERELYEISEVRKWFALAYPRVKYWFYFLVAEGTVHGLKALFACLCDARRTGIVDVQGRPQILLDTKKMGKMFEESFGWLNEMTDRLGMNVEKNKAISFAVMDVFAIPHGT
jgi:hypothetical protein